MTQAHNRRAIILTALAVEYNAVRAHLRDVQEVTYKGSVYETGLFPSEKAPWEICIAQVDVGNAAVAFEAERAMTYFDPEVALFIGIAGGIKDVKLGDVVASTKVYGYESGTFIFKSFHALPDVDESSHALIQRAKAEARRNNWQQRISAPSRAVPTVYVGPIAAGEKALDSSATPIISFLQKTYNDTLAVEMQGRGFLKAIHANQSVQALIVRGIANLLETKPGPNAQKFQKIAADHASAFAFEMLAQLSQPAASPTSAPILGPVIEEVRKDLQLVDIYVHEVDKKPVLDITLHNAGNRLAAPKRVRIEILDVGKFHYDNGNNERSFNMVEHSYDVTLSPSLHGQVKEIQISHKILPDDVERFDLTIGQDVDMSTIAYIWYRLKLTIVYDAETRNVESEPIMVSIPPVNTNKYNIWHAENSTYHKRNEDTWQRMATLSATQSQSIQMAIQQHKDNPLSSQQAVVETNNYHSALRDGSLIDDIRQDALRDGSLIDDIRQDALRDGSLSNAIDQGSQVQKPKPLEIFFSYAKEDERLIQQLSNQLATLKVQNIITDWHAGKILPGAQIDHETMKHLDSAQIILLLISPDFIASQSTSREMAYALERNGKQQTRVIPILLRPTADWKNAPFGKLQISPKNEKAITTWPRRDLAFATVAEEIGDVVKSINGE
jgi:nucleoside phosphorylase